jgi:hypothetical protein
MGEIKETRESRKPRDDSTYKPSTETNNILTGPGMHVAQPPKKTFLERVKEPGSVWQIIITTSRLLGRKRYVQLPLPSL